MATLPAYASCAAQQQGSFWPMSKLIWEKGFGKDLGQANMEKLAGELKLNLSKFKADMAGEKCKTDVANDQRALSAVGVRGTPAFYINGRYLSGARPYEAFKTIVDEELKKADLALARGVRREDLYQQEVLEKGKKSL